jgi:hypothetical protein
MGKNSYQDLFTSDELQRLFPETRTDRFFEALFGDADEGAYDIRLAFKGHDDNCLRFELQMIQRPGKCLACHLTYGLPQVFSRHPVINLKGLVADIAHLIEDGRRVEGWELGVTRELSRSLHVIPLVLHLEE